jgi:hypothetical protein
MLNSFAMSTPAPHRHAIRPNSPHAASFPKKRRLTRGNFRHFLCAPEPVEAPGVSYRGTAREDKMQLSIRFFPKLRNGDSLMTITAAHISPIMSLIAGLLILIMPRLLNLVVAIFLILNGLIGLGLLRWLHL